MLGGLGFVAFGAWFLVDPIGALALAGIGVSGAAAATEFRAFYGGLELALGWLLIACAVDRRRRSDGLLLMLATYAGVAIARGIGLAIDREFTAFLQAALATEIGLAALAAIAWMRLKRDTG
jgi:hypothetical protein